MIYSAAPKPRTGGMNQADYLAWARTEVKRSQRWRTQQKFDDDWRRYIDLYRGKQYDKETNEDQLVVNIIFSTINTMAPAVAVNNPKFLANARRPDTAPQAVIAQELLNYLWQTYQYQDEFRLAVLDWLICGLGWVKIGYKFAKPPENKKDSGSVQDNNADGVGADDDGVDDRDNVPGNVETEAYICEDRPFVERISLFDMFVDPDARHPKEMRWIAQRTWRPIQDVRVDSRYESGPRKNVSGTGRSRWSSDGDTDGRGNDTPDNSKTYVEVIEFYDIKRNNVMTFALDGGGDEGEKGSGFLIKPAVMPYAKGHPFVMLRNYEVPDNFYPVGDVSQIESLQLELNSTRTQMMNHRKRFSRKWIYNRDAFGADGLRALESNADNVMIPVDGDMFESLERLIAPMPAVITPSEFYDQSGLITNDIDRVSGVSEYARGTAQTSVKRTATEAAMIQDSANSRSQDRLAKIESVLAQIGERIIALMQQYMTGEQVMRIVTMPGNTWVNYDQDYIKGEFDFSVAAGSTEPQNETFRRQSAMQLVDASMPFLDMGVANPYGLYMHILQRGFGVQDVSQFIKMPEPPAPDPSTAMPQGLPPQQGSPGGGPGGPPAGPTEGAAPGPPAPLRAV